MSTAWIENREWERRPGTVIEIVAENVELEVYPSMAGIATSHIPDEVIPLPGESTVRFETDLGEGAKLRRDRVTLLDMKAPGDPDGPLAERHFVYTFPDGRRVGYLVSPDCRIELKRRAIRNVNT